MILGLTGSFGAGKGTVVDYLKSKGFTHYSASGFITEEIKRRGLPVDRDSMIVVSNDMRKEHGPTYIIETLFLRAQAAGGDAIIESIREVAGAKFIKEQGGHIIGVDAKPELRYERSVKRGSEKDAVSFEKWLAQEKEESNTTDPHKQNIFGSLKESDIIVNNDGSLEELHAQVDAALTELHARA